MGSKNSENSMQIAGALTYPTREDNNLESVPEQPRQPKNLQGLLRFAMEATKVEDAYGISELVPIDDERKKFLEEALKSLTVDVPLVLHTAIKLLKDTEAIKSIKLGHELPEDVDLAFTNVRELVINIDVAKDFCKMGGYSIFPVCFGSENDIVRAQAMKILAEVCQNNPYCQARALEWGLLNILLHLVQTEEGEALGKCLYAISCLTRNYEPACRELISQGGCKTIVQFLHCGDRLAGTKAAFIITCLARSNPQAKAEFLKHDAIRILTKELKKGLDEAPHCVLDALLALTEGMDKAAMQQFNDPTTGLLNVLVKLWTSKKLKGANYDEDRKNVKTLIDRFIELSDEEDTSDDSADR